MNRRFRQDQEHPTARLVGYALLVSSVLGACSGPTEGSIACEERAECPSGWHCRADMRCWSTPDQPADASLDALLDASLDAAPPRDSSIPLEDAAHTSGDAGDDATTLDGGVSTDASVLDGGADEDGGGGPADAGTDGGSSMPDAGAVDAGVDAGTLDAGSDAGALDAGSDAGTDSGGPCSGLPLATFYQDVDGDGHGSAASGTSLRCSAGDGYVASDDDCDDTSATRYPTANELCNGIDDDCDSTIDEGAALSCGLANASATCSGGFCEVASCDVGFDNCDGADANGCEVDLRTTAAHCGTCGTTCGAGLGCSSSTCEVSPVVQVAMGEHMGCARRSNGRVACWGHNSGGELGDGTTSPRLGAVSVLTIDDAIDLAGGLHTACVVRSGGEVWCWGTDDAGELGGARTVEYGNPPTRVPGISDAVQVAAGAHTFCARRATGRVVCWGTRGSAASELGDGVTTGGSFVSATAVLGVSDAVDIDASPSGPWCVVRATGTLVCWGNTFGATPSAPSSLSAITSATRLALSGQTACTLDSSGAVTCIEFVYAGGATVPTPAPTGVSELAATDMSFCARTSGGAVVCWGQDYYGELGRGTFGGPPVTTPGTVAGLDTTVDLGSYMDSLCAVSSTGAVRCWGENNFGELGDGTTTNRASPVTVVGL